MSPTIRNKYKYFHSTVQRVKDRRQKFHFCRLPFDVGPRNVKLNPSTTFLQHLLIFISGENRRSQFKCQVNETDHQLKENQNYVCWNILESSDNSAQKDIKARLNKARCAFCRLKKTSGSLSSLALRLKCASTAVTLNLCYRTALNAGELSKGTKTKSIFFTIAVC